MSGLSSTGAEPSTYRWTIVALDIAYDVRGPLIGAILQLILTVIVLVPHAEPLWRFLLPPQVTDRPSDVRFRWLHHVTVVKGLVLVWVLGTLVSAGLERRSVFFGAGRPIYGLFDVEPVRSPDATVDRATTLSTAWRRVGSAGRSDSNALIVQFANSDVRQFTLEDNPSRSTWRVRRGRDEIATFRYELQADGVVFLDGVIGKEPVKVLLRPTEPGRFPLLDWR